MTGLRDAARARWLAVIDDLRKAIIESVRPLADRPEAKGVDVVRETMDTESRFSEEKV